MGNSGNKFSSGGSISREGFTGSTKKGGSGNYFLNSDRSGRLNVSVNRFGRDGRDGHDGRGGHGSWGGHGRDYYCGCHRPRHDCHYHRHSSYWFGFGFGSSYYDPIYPVYPVYPAYAWPVYYEPVVVPTYVAAPAPVVVQGATGVYGQPAPGVEVQTPGAYATVPPGQEPVPQAQPQQQVLDPQQQVQPQPQQQPVQPPAVPSTPDTNQSGGMSTEEMDRLMKEGVESFANGDYEKSAQNFMKVSMAIPDNVDALLAYAISRFATGDYANSATAIRRGVRKVPEVVNSLFDLRDRYGKMSDFDGHVANLVRYVNQKKDDVDGWLVLGFVQHFIGDRPHSKETFEGVKKRSPADADVADLFINAKPIDQLVKEAQAAAAAASQPSAETGSTGTQPTSVGQAAPEATAAPTVEPESTHQHGDFGEPFGTPPS